ncbi:MAG: FAD-dependent monooxygenase, partial [Solirubrobacteraceae bacterium]
MSALARAALSVTVVGGGPAGLLYAAVAKRRHPRHEIVVYERNAPDATFGFGVVFSERTLDELRDVEPRTHAAIEASSVAWQDIEVRHRGTVLRCGGHGFFAISRRRLLSILQERAADAGVELRFRREATPDALDGDLVLAADGANSRLREAGAAAFGPSVATGAARYIWFATTKRFDALTFLFAEDEHGHWGVHAYPFEDGASTFIVECDEATWRRAELDTPEARALGPGESDERSRSFCERLFAEHLEGEPLLENNSRWLSFRTVRNARWHDGRTALLGDAAHTAHFSVGSGTKMAMEDAVGLADAIGEAETVASALQRYESGRRPKVEYIQRAAVPSQAWWERFALVAGRPPAQFAFHFLTRSPPVTRARLRARDPRFVRVIDRWFAGAHGDGDVAAGPLAMPVEVAGLHCPSRVVAAAPPAGTSRAVRLAALGGAALFGAGVVLAGCRAGEGVGAAAWREAIAWVHERTGAPVGLRLAAGEGAAAAAAGFD